jgi:uncharacterized protein Yka (UPF0111/DUF47 family)
LRLSLIPRQGRFYELFEKEAALVCRSLDELSSSLSDGSNAHDRLRDLEHECDDVARDIYNLTNVTFTTPMEPEDILNLAHSLDGVVDLAEEISDKVELYRAKPIPEPAKKLGACLAAAGAQLEKAVQNLERPEQLTAVLREVHRLENEGDSISRDALMRLFNGSHGTPADVIKWKDLYNLLETAIDQCESVAEIIETITFKNG